MAIFYYSDRVSAIPVVKEETYLYKYKPFTTVNLLARLDEESITIRE
jgi:hypothetical protein